MNEDENIQYTLIRKKANKRDPNNLINNKILSDIDFNPKEKVKIPSSATIYKKNKPKRILNKITKNFWIFILLLIYCSIYYLMTFIIFQIRFNTTDKQYYNLTFWKYFVDDLNYRIPIIQYFLFNVFYGICLLLTIKVAIKDPGEYDGYYKEDFMLKLSQISNKEDFVKANTQIKQVDSKKLANDYSLKKNTEIIENIIKANISRKVNDCLNCSFNPINSNIFNNNHNIDTTKNFFNFLYSIANLNKIDNLCKFCLIFKSKHTHHCKKCSVCVLGYDHHCLLLSNCIGVNNHKSFIQLLFYGIIQLIIQLWILTSSYLNLISLSNLVFEKNLNDKNLLNNRTNLKVKEFLVQKLENQNNDLFDFFYYTIEKDNLEILILVIWIICFIGLYVLVDLLIYHVKNLLKNKRSIDDFLNSRNHLEDIFPKRFNTNLFSRIMGRNFLNWICPFEFEKSDSLIKKYFDIDYIEDFEK